MSELRQDRTSGAWVIIAPERSRRPRKLGPEERQSDAHLRFDPTCPFCPGHEAMLPGIVAETSADDPPGWSVRVVPNKFPALRLPEDSAVPVRGRRAGLPGCGVHEVVIESPRHDADLSTMTKLELFGIVSMYARRSRALLDLSEIETVIVFRNQGSKSGASLAHPHAQIIGLGLVSPRMDTLIDTGLHHFEQTKRCVTCDELAIELEHGTRLVDQNEQFAAIVPFAAQHPYELWLMPKNHRASFPDADNNELQGLTDILSRSLQRLKVALDNPAYSFAVVSAPKSNRKAPFLHWRLRIVPKIVTWGGFELGADLPINPSSPEADASVLREVQIGI